MMLRVVVVVDGAGVFALVFAVVRVTARVIYPETTYSFLLNAVPTNLQTPDRNSPCYHVSTGPGPSHDAPRGQYNFPAAVVAIAVADDCRFLVLLPHRLVPVGPSLLLPPPLPLSPPHHYQYRCVSYDCCCCYRST